MDIQLRELQHRVEAEAAPVARLLDEVRKIIVGQALLLDRLVIGMLTTGHILVEGVPGLAKTLAVKTLAQTHRREIPAHPVHAGPPAGGPDRHADLQPEGRELQPEEGPHFHQHHPGRRDQPRPGQGAERASGGHAGAPGDDRRTRPSPLDEPFFVLATQNPIEQEGTYPLPEAQVDRFMLKVSDHLPDQEGGAR